MPSLLLDDAEVHTADRTQRRRTLLRAALAVGAGLAWALASPPLGWWPLLPVGVGLLALALAGRGLRSRAALGGLAGLVFYGITLRWLVDFSPPGYVVLALLEAGLLAVAAALVVPRHRGAGASWWSLPAALVLLEAVQTRFPLGGFPLPALSLTQLDAPWAAAAPLGGSLLVTAGAAMLGAGVAVALTAADARRRQVTALAAVAVLTVMPAAVGSQLRTSPAGELDVAVVQGGGPRGTRAVFSDADLVTERHLRVAAPLQGRRDLVLFPEGIVDPEGPMAGSAAEPAFAALARRLDATVVVGVVEGAATRFRNAALAYGPDGRLGARYDKEHRVPFGEYIPARGLIERLTDATALVPKDAIVGEGDAVLPSPKTPLGVVISFEVFFADRVREGVRAGGRIVLVPTNASSYVGPEVPTAEVAAARMRAREFGRTVLQAAPTGYSAVVLADGEVTQRSELGQPALLEQRVALRTGLTPYARVGDAPVLVLATAALGAPLLLRRGRRRRAGHDRAPEAVARPACDTVDFPRETEHRRCP